MNSNRCETYTFPLEKLNEFIDLVHEHASNAVKSNVADLLETHETMLDCQKILDKHPDIEKESTGNFKRLIHGEFLEKMLLKGRGSNSLYDVECKYLFWIDGNQVYAMPSGARWIWQDIKYPEWVSELSFVDTVDDPKRIASDKSDKVERHERIWDLLGHEDPKKAGKRMLVHEIVRLSPPSETWNRIMFDVLLSQPNRTKV